MSGKTDIYTYKRNVNRGRVNGEYDSKKRLRNVKDFFGVEMRQALNLKMLTLCIIAFFMGRGLILGELLPFAAAFLAAYTVMQRRGSLFITLVTGLGLATIISGLQLAVAFLNLFSLYLFLKFINVEPNQRWVAVPLLVFSLTIIIKTSFVALFEPNFYNYVVVLFEAFLAGLLAVVFLVALRPLESKELKLFRTNEELLCTFILITGVIVGLGEIQIGMLSLKAIISRFIIMVGAFWGGAGIGALAGTLVGLIPSIGNLIAPTIIGLYAFSGLMAGLFKRFSKLGIALGFMLGNILLSIYFTSTGNLLASLGESAIAALAFLVIPAKFMMEIKEKFKGLVPDSEDTEKAVMVKGDATPKIKQLSKVFNELARTFKQISCETETSEEKGLKSFIEGVSGKLCKKCPKERYCWAETELYKTYKGFVEAFTLLEQNEELNINSLSDELHRKCTREMELVLALNSTYETYKVNYFWQNKLVESRDIVSDQLKGVALVMDNLAEELNLEAEQDMFKANKPVFELNIGIAKVGKGGSVVSGDNYATMELQDNKRAIVLSDGMGAGPKAAMESKAAISLLKQLMKSGISKDVAVKTVNSVLLLRSTEESFATVDLAVIDLNTAETDFLKIGASPSFIKSKNKVKVIKSNSLPIGILNNIQMETIKRSLQAGDILVMASDGVLDSRQQESDNEGWLIDFLENLLIDDPQDIADLILWHAKNNGGGRILDDMTVLVVKVDVTDAF